MKSYNRRGRYDFNKHSFRIAVRSQSKHEKTSFVLLSLFFFQFSFILGLLLPSSFAIRVFLNNYSRSFFIRESPLSLSSLLYFTFSLPSISILSFIVYSSFRSRLRVFPITHIVGLIRTTRAIERASRGGIRSSYVFIC